MESNNTLITYEILNHEQATGKEPCDTERQEFIATEGVPFSCYIEDAVNDTCDRGGAPYEYRDSAGKEHVCENPEVNENENGDVIVSDPDNDDYILEEYVVIDAEPATQEDIDRLGFFLNL